MTKLIPPKIKENRVFYLQVLFAVLAFVLMVVLSYIFMSSIVHDSLVDSANSVLDFAERQVTTQLGEYETTISTGAEEVRGMLQEGESLESLREYTRSVARFAKMYGGTDTGIQNIHIYINDIDGGPALIDGSGGLPEDTSPEGFDWYRMAVASPGELIQTVPAIDAGGEVYYTYAISLLGDGGEQLGVVAMDVRLNVTGQEVVNTALDQGGYGMMFNQDLMVMFHPEPKYEGVYLSDPSFPPHVFYDRLSRGEDIFESPLYSFRNEASRAFFRTLPNQWYIGVVVPEEQFYAGTRSMGIMMTALGVLFATALIVILIRMENERSRSDNENKQKSMFLANMSHEIRTPLNVIVGLSELALDGDWLEDETEDKLEKIYASGMLILSIVNDILDISKLESGKFAIYPIQYDTPSLINDVVTLNIVRIGDKQITFKLEVDENLPGALIGDDLRIKQIFNNLLSNAFKYTESGTVVWRVNFEIDGDCVWLISEVEDTGIGIRPDDVKLLFSDYQQVDMSANRKVEGTGLGLTIAKNLVEMMDGSITVESEYGKGTRFKVRLRQKFVHSAPIGEEIAHNLMTKNYTVTKRARNMKLLRVDLSYARVLVVDDIATNLDVTRGMMKPYSLQVDCVTGGRQAVDLIRQGEPRYDAIFMDHMMPGMDGVEATRIIREEIGTNYAEEIPIIALTANAILGNKEMFLANGFQDFISKPIDMSKLDATLRKWVRNKEKESMQLAANEAAEESLAAEESGGAGVNVPAIAGVDMPRALERFSGDEGILFDVLRSYAVNTRPLLAALQKHLEEKNLTDYAIVVHGIKGSSYGIFAKDVGRAAEALEAASKAGDLEEVTAGQPIFERMAVDLLDRVDAALRDYDGATDVRPRAAAPDPAALMALREACRSFDMDGVDAAMERIEAFRYDSGGALVEWLRGKVNDMLFEEVADGSWPEA